MPISVIIPSYRNPDYLDLCLRSATEHQVNENQIIVVLDGYPEESEHVIQKYPGISVIPFATNMGQTKAHNTGVTLAEHDRILIVNDDNVFPVEWDVRLDAVYNEDWVISPNQIEPNPSIFKSFVHLNLGTTPAEFEYSQFERSSHVVSTSAVAPWSDDGQTWPVFMSKKWWMILGGIDPYFPSPAVADWDFFFRCKLAGLWCKRYHGVHFYHFAGAATKRDPEHGRKEQEAFQYFEWKWGAAPMLDANNNKVPAIGNFRGL